MTLQGHAKFGPAPSVCEGHKEHDICARDGGLVSRPLPPAIAVTGRGLSAAFGHGQGTHMLNTVRSVFAPCDALRDSAHWKQFSTGVGGVG